MNFEKDGVTIKDVAQSAKANCVNLQSGGDCDPANWTGCNENLGDGEFFITDCSDCTIDKNALSGDPDLCCDDGLSEN